MKTKQAIDLLKTLKEYYTKIMPNVIPLQREDEKGKDELIQALDHAINCVGAIEQIRAERDIAIQQLNELGYQFGEKIGSEEK